MISSMKFTTFIQQLKGSGTTKEKKSGSKTNTKHSSSPPKMSTKQQPERKNSGIPKSRKRTDNRIATNSSGKGIPNSSGKLTDNRIATNSSGKGIPNSSGKRTDNRIATNNSGKGNSLPQPSSDNQNLDSPKDEAVKTIWSGHAVITSFKCPMGYSETKDVFLSYSSDGGFSISVL